MAMVGETVRRLNWLTFARQTYLRTFGTRHAVSSAGEHG